MKKLALLTLLAVAVSSINSVAHDDHKAKTAEKCTKGGDCCKKGTSKAAMMKAAAKSTTKRV